MANHVDAHGGRLYKIVDVSDDSTTVYAGPARLWHVRVETALSAHALPIVDGATTIYSLAASAAAGTKVDFDGVTFQTNLIIDPNDSATGSVVVCYEPVPEIY